MGKKFWLFLKNISYVFPLPAANQNMFERFTQTVKNLKVLINTFQAVKTRHLIVRN